MTAAAVADEITDRIPALSPVSLDELTKQSSNANMKKLYKSSILVDERRFIQVKKGNRKNAGISRFDEGVGEL